MENKLSGIFESLKDKDLFKKHFNDSE